LSTLTQPLTEHFHNALAYASQLHETQSRKGTEIPYISHLMAVAGIVLEAGGSEDEAIAALLHDAAEDQGGEARLDDIRNRFGATVADIVEHCSDTFETPKPPWEERKAAYHARLRHADKATLLVSIADKLHNARSTLHDLQAKGPAVWDRFSVARDRTMWNYRTLLAIYEAAPHDPHREPLQRQLRAILDAIDEIR
jgi:(p)ppGpp synthase/HD superfamily hydrolase